MSWTYRLYQERTCVVCELEFPYETASYEVFDDRGNSHGPHHYNCLPKGAKPETNV